MRNRLLAITAAVVSLGMGLVIVGCGSSTATPKDKMSADKMTGSDKMNADKMSADKMKADKMNADKMAGDKKDKM